MRRRGGLTATFLVLALGGSALGGCGGGDRVKTNNMYVASADRVVRAFETQFQRLQTDFTPVSTAAQDRKTLGALQSAVDEVVLRLGMIDPPATIADLHVQLITRVRQYGGVIAVARRGFASEDPKAVNVARSRFATRLQEVARRVTATITTINTKLR